MSERKTVKQLKHEIQVALVALRESEAALQHGETSKACEYETLSRGWKGCFKMPPKTAFDLDVGKATHGTNAKVLRLC